MFDAQHIEDCYDKYMGNDSYYELCKKLDLMLKENKIDPFILKKVMKSLALFHNRKNANLFSSGAISEDELMNSINSFNRIFNEMQKEYDIYFYQTDISTFKPFQFRKETD